MKTMTKDRPLSGYTIVEMMVVVAIIGILASIAVPNVIRAINNARKRQALSDLEIISTAVMMLAHDTGKFPAGNLTALKSYDLGDGISSRWNTEISDLERDLSGLLPGAEDEFEDYGWKGPYLDEVPKDPWGNNYWFDPDYLIGRWYYPVVGSAGPNGRGVANNVYDSDNIFFIVGAQRQHYSSGDIEMDPTRIGMSSIDASSGGASMFMATH